MTGTEAAEDLARHLTGRNKPWWRPTYVEGRGIVVALDPSRVEGSLNHITNELPRAWYGFPVLPDLPKKKDKPP